MLRIDPNAVADIVKRICAEEMLPRFRGLAAHEIREKSPGDPVTVVDEACEARLIDALTSLLPGSLVVGEEGAAADPSLLGRIAGSDPVWIIDPLDGTRNFSKGIDRFASIVALSVDGETVFGCIHDPVRQVTGLTERGQGAWIGDRRLAVGPPMPAKRTAVIATESMWPRHRRPGLERLKGAFGTLRGFACAGLEYLHLADGASDIAAPAKLMPWDHAAGVLMYQEAGGHPAMSDGTPYAPTRMEPVLILAPDESVWHQVADLLEGSAGADVRLAEAG